MPNDRRDVRIRPATPADIVAITRIYADAVTNGTASYELEPPGVAEMARRFEALVGVGFPYLVADEAGHVLGYAYAGPFRTRPAYRFVVENSVYVAHEARGRGLGSLLMEALIAEAEKLGFRQIIAVIGDGHPSNSSVRLHEKLGFRHVGRLEGSGYKHERWLDTVLMQLSLNGGASGAPDSGSLADRLYRGEDR